MTESTGNRGPASYRAALGGVLLVLAAGGILMGIITGEALYPAVYTTHDNEISDLGATRPPDSIILQPSATIFNVTMIVSGIAIMAGAWLTYFGQRSRRALVAVGLLGFGALGVGVFPGNNPGFHPLFALLTFISGGVAAVIVAPLLAAPFRYVSIGLGVTSLGSLAFGIFGTGTAVFEDLGDGGVERWVAYPIILWMVAYGGYLAARHAPDARDHRPTQTPR